MELSSRSRMSTAMMRCTVIDDAWDAIRSTHWLLRARLPTAAQCKNCTSRNALTVPYGLYKSNMDSEIARRMEAKDESIHRR